MIFDAQARFGKATSFATAVAANVVFGDVIDLWEGRTAAYDALPVGFNGEVGGPMVPDAGKGLPISVYAQVTTAIAGNATSTFSLWLVASAATGLTTPDILWAWEKNGQNVNTTPVPAGTVFTIDNIPVGATKRYLGFLYTVGTATLTGGAMTAGIVAQRATSHI